MVKIFKNLFILDSFKSKFNQLIPQLCGLVMENDNSSISTASIQALTIICQDHTENCQTALNCGFLSYILELMVNNTDYQISDLTGILVSLSSEHSVKEFLKETNCLQILLRFLYNEDNQVRADVLKIFSNLSTEPYWSEMIINSGEVTQIIEWCTSGHPHVQKNSILLLGNLSSEYENKEILSSIDGFISTMINLFNSPDQGVFFLQCNIYL